MATRIIRQRVCDRCEAPAQALYRLTRYKGKGRSLDLCPEHAAPVEELINLRLVKHRNAKPRTVLASEADIPKKKRTRKKA